MAFSRCLIFCLLFVSLPAQAEELLAVASVINGKSCVLATGDTVRFASIEAPNTFEPADAQHHARDGEPLGDEAKAALTTLLTGRKIRVEPTGQGRDRHNRLLGQVYRDDGLWLQGEMLRQGWAMVYSFRDDAPDVIAKMLTAEQEARAAKRGIWANPYFRVIAPTETGEFINRFKIVEGKIVSVNVWHDNVYINFSEQWKGQFAAYIPRKFVGDFTNISGLAGKTVRLRGWIHYHKAPMIDLTTPLQMEVE